MINTKSVKWSEVSEESKREQWRLYHIYNTFNAIFFGDTFNSQDSIEEAEVTGGHQWVYTWNNPSEAPESTENGILEFPVFTKEHYSENWYSMPESNFSNCDEEYIIENGEPIKRNSDSN